MKKSAFCKVLRINSALDFGMIFIQSKGALLCKYRYGGKAHVNFRSQESKKNI